MAEVAPAAPSNRPKNTPLRQHRMAGLTCAPSSPALSVLYFVVGAAFIGYGVLIVLETSLVVEIETRYDYLDECRAHWWGGSVCSVNVTVSSEMTAPVFLYYSVKYMYLNNRYFSKSKDAIQLMGSHRTKEEVQKSCFPVITMKDLGRNTSLPLGEDDVANPCGSYPRAMFNDTFSLTHLDTGRTVEIREDGIAWGSDKKQKYERTHDSAAKQWIDVENEHFMVWMGVSGLPHFRKLWGRIEDSLPAGNYQFQITSNYDTSRFGGEKWVVLTSTCAFGGRISFLGIVYIAVGGVSVLGSAIICSAHYLRKRRLFAETRS